MKIKVGTRGSILAVTQTKQVIKELISNNPDLEAEIVIIKTRGDLDQKSQLDKFNDKGVFVQEIENALLENKIDLAIHSMKDMPSEVTKGLMFVNPPKMQRVEDVLVLRDGLFDLDKNAEYLIGTGSKRRIYQLKHIYKNANTKPIRGNVETRIKKIKDENLDGTILAYAGLLRASMDKYVTKVLNPKEFLPSPNQGILALQIRENDEKLKEICSKVEDKRTSLILDTQREFQKVVGAGCHSPLGVYTELSEDLKEISIYGVFGNEEGSILIKDEIHGKTEDRISLSIKLANSLKERVFNHE